jgi:hypothetical protein
MISVCLHQHLLANSDETLQAHQEALLNQCLRRRRLQRRPPPPATPERSWEVGGTAAIVVLAASIKPTDSECASKPLTSGLRLAAGVVGALALVALLAAAFIFYKRNQAHKGEGAAGIATTPRRGPQAPEPADAARQRHTPCQAPTLPARLAPTRLPSS